MFGLLFFAVCALEMISASPIKNGGMVFYQSYPDYFNANRAYVMQYASQPLKARRRTGPAAGVSAYASGKKISAKTYLKRNLFSNNNRIDKQPYFLCQRLN